MFSVIAIYSGFTLERNVSPFHAIECNGIANIKVHFGQDYRVTIDTARNHEQYIDISVRNDTLYIETKPEPGSRGPVDFAVDIYTQDINNVVLSGAVNMELDNGIGINLTVINTGVGNFNGSNYQVKNATVSVTTPGTIRIWATDELDVTVSGIGTVYYHGNPNIRQSITGLGKINRE
jgi:hypothetical protein